MTTDLKLFMFPAIQQDLNSSQEWIRVGIAHQMLVGAVMGDAHPPRPYVRVVGEIPLGRRTFFQNRS